MGDRLVSVISKDEKVLAASYQHWAASGHHAMHDIIEANIADWKGEIDQEAAVKILIKSLHDFNENDRPIVLELEHYDWYKDDGIPFSSEEEKKFASLHPEIITDWDKASRTDGLICINEQKIDDWRAWSEWEDWYEV